MYALLVFPNFQKSENKRIMFPRRAPQTARHRCEFGLGPPYWARPIKAPLWSYLATLFSLFGLSYFSFFGPKAHMVPGWPWAHIWRYLATLLSFCGRPYRTYPRFSDFLNIFRLFQIFSEFSIIFRFYQHSQTFPNMFRWLQTCWDCSQHLQISKHVHISQTFSDCSQHVQVFRNFFRCFPTCSDCSQRFQFFSNMFIQTLPTCSFLGPNIDIGAGGPVWSKMSYFLYLLDFGEVGFKNESAILNCRQILSHGASESPPYDKSIFVVGF